MPHEALQDREQPMTITRPGHAQQQQTDEVPADGTSGVLADLSAMSRPPSNDCVAAAIARLPAPHPDLPPQVVEVTAWPDTRRFRITFVVRRYPIAGSRTWFWGIEKLEPLSGDPPSP
jgi:hypothetical protein